jgi:predicted phosphohydrolase
MSKGSGSCQERKAMNIFAFSDPHLGPATGKSHYSSSWENHQSKMRKAWDKEVDPDALVLMPGDFSWHRDEEDMYYDYLWLNDRPGKKILSKGNHDSNLWQDQDKLRTFIQKFAQLESLTEQAIRLENPWSGPGLVLVGVEGSQSPQDQYFNTNSGVSAFGKEPESVRFLQEMLALKRGLDQAQELQQENDELIVMIHYPPRTAKESSIFSRLIEQSGAKLCLYGHLHQKKQWGNTFQGESGGCEYRFVGADYLDWTPSRIGTWTSQGLEIPEYQEPEPSEQESDTSNLASSSSSDHPSLKTHKLFDACQECGDPIYHGQPSHLTFKGAVHGHGKYGQKNTCEYMKQKDVTKEHRASKKNN